ncbi:MAG: aldehyde dehydrogenase family protein [Lewinellaceae bacterium]|nr:aldehyde dehydrogenase family protein [Lewinellaceae bacterium]
MSLVDIKKEDLQVEIDEVFKLQKANRFAVGRTTARERREKLDRLKKALFRYQQDIRDAMYADFRKHQVEVDLTELFTVKDEINFVKKNLGRWMSPQPVGKSLLLLGSRSYIHYEPKGLTLILAPWNFPVLLTLGPLVSAIAAGNCAIVKPSEFVPHTSAVLKRMLDELFPKEEVYLLEGDLHTAQALLRKPFNHIFFTGSPGVGKQVMKSASEHLTSVTLELGGKSPGIVDETADLPMTALRVAWGKCVNKGQVCVAPDNLWVQESVAEPFLKAFKASIRQLYGDSVRNSVDYARIVDARHFQRLKGILEDALENGASVELGGELDAADNYISPTLLRDVPMDSRVMQEEIFGPILPFRTFKTLDEPIEYLRKQPYPLALYIYSRNKKNVDRLIRETRAGTTAVNENNLHFFQNRLPFGGLNESGIGKGHGYSGFLEFTNARSIYKQGWPDMLPLITPPYSGFKKRLAELILRWL